MACATSAGAQPILARATVKVAGAERAYFAYVSSKANGFSPTPLVLVVGEADRDAWIAVAEANGIALVLPQAGPQGWRGDGSDSAALKAVFDHAAASLVSRGLGDAGTPLWAWETLRHIVGVGPAAAAADALVIEYPGLFAGVALSGPPADPAVAALGDLPAQAYFTHARGLIADPDWRQLRRDVPQAIWRYGSRDGRDTVPALFPELADTKTEPTPTQVWSRFLGRIARWSSSPNGDRARIPTESEVARDFVRRSIRLDDGDHFYLVHRPPAWRAGAPLPVVISLHGRFEPAWRFLGKMRIHDTGDRAGFVTVYPEGRGNRWDTDPGSFDARFLAALPAALVRDDGIDAARVYLEGFSNGSAMTHMMGMTRPDLFAAISPNNASVVTLPPAGTAADLRYATTMMSPAVAAAAAAAKAKYDWRLPVFYINGVADSEFAPDGRVAQTAMLNAQKDFWKKFNHIGTPDRTAIFTPSDGRAAYTEVLLSDEIVHSAADARWPGGRIATHRYRTDDPGHAVLYTFSVVADLPHAFDFREADAMWAFFKRFRREADGRLTIVGGDE